MSTVEVKIGNTVNKFEFVEEDIDTMLVISKDDNKLLKGFETEDVLGHKKRGMIVHKKDCYIFAGSDVVEWQYRLWEFE